MEQRDQRVSETHGQYQRLTSRGYAVVCKDRDEALRVVMVAGAQSFPHHQRGAMNDANYLKWLLENYYRVTPGYELTGSREMTAPEWLNQWAPSSEQFLRGDPSPVIVHRMLEAQGVRTDIGDMVAALLANRMPQGV